MRQKLAMDQTAQESSKRRRVGDGSVLPHESHAMEMAAVPPHHMLGALAVDKPVTSTGVGSTPIESGATAHRSAHASETTEATSIGATAVIADAPAAHAHETRSAEPILTNIDADTATSAHPTKATAAKAPKPNATDTTKYPTTATAAIAFKDHTKTTQIKQPKKRMAKTFKDDNNTAKTKQPKKTKSTKPSKDTNTAKSPNDTVIDTSKHATTTTAVATSVDNNTKSAIPVPSKTPSTAKDPTKTTAAKPSKFDTDTATASTIPLTTPITAAVSKENYVDNAKHPKKTTAGKSSNDDDIHTAKHSKNTPAAKSFKDNDTATGKHVPSNKTTTARSSKVNLDTAVTEQPITPIIASTSKSEDSSMGPTSGRIPSTPAVSKHDSTLLPTTPSPSAPITTPGAMAKGTERPITTETITRENDVRTVVAPVADVPAPTLTHPSGTQQDRAGKQRSSRATKKRKRLKKSERRRERDARADASERSFAQEIATQRHPSVGAPTKSPHTTDFARASPASGTSTKVVNTTAGSGEPILTAYASAGRWKAHSEEFHEIPKSADAANSDKSTINPAAFLPAGAANRSSISNANPLLPASNTDTLLAASNADTLLPASNADKLLPASNVNALRRVKIPESLSSIDVRSKESTLTRTQSTEILGETAVNVASHATIYSADTPLNREAMPSRTIITHASASHAVGHAEKAKSVKKNVSAPDNTSTAVSKNATLSGTTSTTKTGDVRRKNSARTKRIRVRGNAFSTHEAKVSKNTVSMDPAAPHLTTALRDPAEGILLRTALEQAATHAAPSPSTAPSRPGSDLRAFGRHVVLSVADITRIASDHNQRVHRGPIAPLVSGDVMEA